MPGAGWWWTLSRQIGVFSEEPYRSGLIGLTWRKLYQDGSLSAVSADEQVVPASNLSDAMKQIRELQRLLGKKTMEVEILREAMEYGRAKNFDCALTIATGGRPLKKVCDVLGVSFGVSMSYMSPA